MLKRTFLRRPVLLAVGTGLAIGLLVLTVFHAGPVASQGAAPPVGGLPATRTPAAGPNGVNLGALQTVGEGRQIFRFDTFGDEDFWGGALRLHEAIKGSNLGGVGPGVSPRAALGLGLKVDVDALPASLVQQLRANQVNLDDPATTLALLKLDSVVGLRGSFDPQGNLQSVGITCALCHSTVDDSLAPGIGHRLDGWANRDLNVGQITALAPNLQPFADLLGVDVETVRQVVTAWGPGKFDAELVLDGKGFRPDGQTAATLIPPAFGLAGWSLHTYTAWGSVPYWNALVANLEMHGKGRFFDPRLGNADKFPVAVRTGELNVSVTPDLITSKLPPLHIYQLSLESPAPPSGSFDPQAAARGQALFTGKANCNRCHTLPLTSEPGWPVHRGAEIGIDEFQASRSPENGYRTAKLQGLWTHTKGGFFHDGRFPTLGDVVQHYNSFFNLGLNEQEVNDLVEYLKSL